MCLYCAFVSVARDVAQCPSTDVIKVIWTESYSSFIIANFSCLNKRRRWPSSLLSPLLTSLHSEHYDFAESVRKHEAPLTLTSSLKLSHSVSSLIFSIFSFLFWDDRWVKRSPVSADVRCEYESLALILKVVWCCLWELSVLENSGPTVSCLAWSLQSASNHESTAEGYERELDWVMGDRGFRMSVKMTCVLLSHLNVVLVKSDKECPPLVSVYKSSTSLFLHVII